MSFRDLQSFLQHLEKEGELRRVTVEVDPRFEPTALDLLLEFLSLTLGL